MSSSSSLKYHRDDEDYSTKHDLSIFHATSKIKTMEENNPLTANSQEHPTQPETAADELKKLNDRIKVVRDLITSLGEQMTQEVKLWRKERDEYKIALLENRGDICCWCDLEETTAAARAAAQAYAEESPQSKDKLIIDSGVDVETNEGTKLAVYRQDSLALLAHKEKREKMRLRLIASTYHQSLVDVERLCNEEMENVEKNVKELQPLREMVCKWSFKENDSTPIAINKPISYHQVVLQ